MAFDWVGAFSITGTIVLALILIQQSVATWQERSETKAARKKEERERPQFVLSDKLALDSDTITIGQPKVGIKQVRIRVLKAPVVNKGELMAQNAKPHIGFGQSGLAWPTIWTTHGSWSGGEIILTAPPTLGEGFEATRKFIEVSYFGDPFWSNDFEADVMGGAVKPVIILYTIEGSDFAYPISSSIKPMKFPVESLVGLSIGMENAKPSQIALPKFRLTSWDKLELL